MIRSCRDTESSAAIDRKFSRKFHAIEKVARVGLALLDAATSLRDLNLPGLHLEALKGYRKGRHSTRIDGCDHSVRRALLLHMSTVTIMGKRSVTRGASDQRWSVKNLSSRIAGRLPH